VPSGRRAVGPAGVRTGLPTGVSGARPGTWDAGGMPDRSVPRDPTDAPAHAERLWLGPLGWACVAGFAAVMGVALWPVGVVPALVAAVGVLLVGIAVGVALATPVRVADGELRAGSAHLPLDLVGEVRALDAPATRAELGPALDARAHLCLRAWARTAVRLEVLDPADPTPYWVVSTRRPERLAAAITAGRTRPAARDA